MRTKRTLIAMSSLAVVAVAGLLGAGTAATAPPANDANLSLTKTDSPDPVTVGQTLTYTITVQNNGPANATDVTVVDTLPNSVDFISANPSSGTCTQQSRKVTCHLGALAAGSSGTLSNPTITIQVRPTKVGTITNSATVTSAENDPNRANNSASATTRVNAVPTPPTHTATCRGQTATIVGNRKGNRLVGTGHRDVVQAGRGNDTILTDGGNDLICAGPGADVVKAGGRSDRVFGGPGEDKEFGGGGNDVLKGQGGFDRLFGGRGSDLMNGGPGNDLCRGGAGADDEDRHCELR
jgi:uncharacterized repeat protein (TIGR01451 family)